MSVSQSIYLGPFVVTRGPISFYDLWGDALPLVQANSEYNFGQKIDQSYISLLMPNANRNPPRDFYAKDYIFLDQVDPEAELNWLKEKFAKEINDVISKIGPENVSLKWGFAEWRS